MKCVAVAVCAVAAPTLFAAEETGDMTVEPLVTTDWLADHLDDPDLVVLDCTVLYHIGENGEPVTVSGREAYTKAHIPGAAFADLKGALADSDSPLGYALPAPEDFAAAMSELGVGDDSRVVLYDATGSMWAARVWWMLRWIGFDNVSLLDGGQGAWEAAGHAMSSDAVRPEPRELTVNLRPELIADKEDVRAAIDDPDVNLVDALPEPQYTGERTAYARPGHIASATNVPVFSVFDDAGRFKSKATLESMFEPHAGTRTIHYCGGGIAASGTAFAMALAGYDNVAIYTNSLQEWAADPANPMETGPASSDR